MSPADPATRQQIQDALHNLGNYRVKRVQQVCQGTMIPATVMLSLGLRENGLTNTNGGGVWDPQTQKYKPSKTDRGWLQVSDKIQENRVWLASVPGCPEGSWVPSSGHVALDVGYCPRFTDALSYGLTTLHNNMDFGHSHGVAEKDLLRFAVAAWNTGPTGALNGLHNHGDVDYYSAHGDYSAWVLRYAPWMHDWISSHPGWQWA